METPERPDELPGSNPHPYDLVGIAEAGGTITRSKHRVARDKRKKARLLKRLLKAGTIRKYKRRPA